MKYLSKSNSVQWLDDEERRSFATALELIGDLPTNEPELVRDRADALLLVALLLTETAHRYAGGSGIILPLSTVKHRLGVARSELRQLRAAA